MGQWSKKKKKSSIFFALFTFRFLSLLAKRLDLLDEATDTKDNLSAEGLQRPDIADRAQVESDASIQLRTRDRERKLISKIDAALRRIDLKTYGYCEDTGEPIGLGRRLTLQTRHGHRVENSPPGVF